MKLRQLPKLPKPSHEVQLSEKEAVDPNVSVDRAEAQPTQHYKLSNKLKRGGAAVVLATGMTLTSRAAAADEIDGHPVTQAPPSGVFPGGSSTGGSGSTSGGTKSSTSGGTRSTSSGSTSRTPVRGGTSRPTNSGNNTSAGNSPKPAQNHHVARQPNETVVAPPPPTAEQIAEAAAQADKVARLVEAGKAFNIKRYTDRNAETISPVSFVATPELTERIPDHVSHWPSLGETNPFLPLGFGLAAAGVGIGALTLMAKMEPRANNQPLSGPPPPTETSRVNLDPDPRGRSYVTVKLATPPQPLQQNEVPTPHEQPHILSEV